jgi:hypothetical protein
LAEIINYLMRKNMTKLETCKHLEEFNNCGLFATGGEDPSLSKLHLTTLQGSPVGTIQIPTRLECTATEQPNKQAECSHFLTKKGAK